MKVDAAALGRIRATMLSSARRRHESETLLREQEKTSLDRLRNRLRGAKLTKPALQPARPQKKSMQGLPKNIDIVLIGSNGVPKKLPRTSKMSQHFRPTNLEQQILRKS